MFLKRIEIDGFKSFADKTVLNFDSPITGIVGPNGCGKSNITDAIRWVLGEQSVSALRADKGMSSIIFSGSDSRRTVNYAQVSLVFDNTKHYFNREDDEIIITRRISRKDNSSEYLINKTPCRLRDVIEMTLGSGIAKNSLNIISQGNISNFSDAKPEDRRGVFEEAAGVSLYKKKKTEALNKLANTQDNLDRAADIMNELEMQVIPLENAAKKARKYQEAKDRLEEIETSVLVSDIEFYQGKHEEAKKAEFDLETELAVSETTLQINENSIAEKRENIRRMDREIDAAQSELMRLVNEISNLESRKIEINEKRKYTLESGSSKEKEEALRNAYTEAKQEYESRKEIYDKYLVDIDLLEKQQNAVIMKKIDAEQNFEQASAALKRLNNRKEVLENLMKRPFTQQAGVQAVMDAIHSLPGVLGCVAMELHAHEGYEEAISVGLQGALYNIVTKDPESARNAIEFLKRNESGRATFLPRNILRPRYIKEEDEIVCGNITGYLGVACDFVDCAEPFEIVTDYLLGSVIVVDNLKNANSLAEILKYRYNVVTLDGEIIHRGGSMTGGKARESSSYMTMKKEYDHIAQDIEKQEDVYRQWEERMSRYGREKEGMDAKLWELRVNSAKMEPLLEVKKAKYTSMEAEYQMLNPDEDPQAETDVENELVSTLEKDRLRKDELETALRLNRESRYKANAEVERKEAQVRQYRTEANKIRDKINEVKIDIARVELVLNQNLERLSSEYHMTYEFAKERVKRDVVENAKEEVATLRKKIASLGNVNMDAPQEYAEKSARYEEMKKNYDELMESREKLLSTIADLDAVMTEKFSEMFNRVNEQFSQVFTQLFHGGRARLYLEDPDDLMNTGIEIEANPPGKVIRNNRVLSGGEKTLIAFCTLFAIMKARPLPLCVFDEVDTALDPANNDRFANYLQSVANDSQFIVVTHHPSTMAKCDVLYGVTMANNGVSNILKVQLAEAEQMIQEEE